MRVLSLPIIPFDAAMAQGVGMDSSDTLIVGRYAAIWSRWQGEMHACTQECPERSEPGIACLWLTQQVEAEVDAAWAVRPSEGFVLHCLALELCMAAVRGCIPEVAGTVRQSLSPQTVLAQAAQPGQVREGGARGQADVSCAPLPVLSSLQRDILVREGLLAQEQGAHSVTAIPIMIRRYAVLTWYPFRGGCAVCALRGTCGKVV